MNGEGGVCDRESWTAIIQADSGFRRRQLNSLSGTWNGAALSLTKHADLKQLPFAGAISMQPETWSCEVPGNFEKFLKCRKNFKKWKKFKRYLLSLHGIDRIFNFISS